MSFSKLRSNLDLPTTKNFNTFTLSSWNINGLRTKFSSEINQAPPNKRIPGSTISLEAWVECYEPSVIAFQETKWKEKYTETQKNREKYFIPEYRFRHYISPINDSRSLAFCFHDSVTFVEDGNIGPDSLKSQFIRIQAPDVGKLTIYNVYLPPFTSIDSAIIGKLLGDISAHIRKSRRDGQKIFVMGDFNSHNPLYGDYPQKNASDERVIQEDDFVNKLNLTGQPLDEPSYQRGSNRQFIDRVFYSHKSSVQFCHLGSCLNGIGPTQFPDHRPFNAVLTGRSVQFRPADIKRYNWNSLSENRWKGITSDLLDDLRGRDEWFQRADPNELAEYLRVSFWRERSKNLKPSYVKQNMQPFFNASLRKAKREVRLTRQKLARCRKRTDKKLEVIMLLEERLRNQTKVYSDLRAEGKKMFCDELLDRARGSLDVKHIVTSLKRLRGDRHLSIPVIPDANGSIPKSKLESLNNLNQGFVGVGRSPRADKYSTNFDMSRYEALCQLEGYYRQLDIDSFGWQQQVNALNLDVSDIEAQIMDLKDSAVGPDEVTASFLRNTLPWSSIILYAILIRSLKSTVVPDLYRESDICPIHKGDGATRSAFSGFRPIALTSIPGRVIEGVIAKRLRLHLESNGLIRENQFGARAGHSTSDALTHFYTNVSRIMKSRGVVHTVFLDISKVFDRVDHLALCKKLLKKKVDPVLVTWIFSFLSDRRQRVKIGGDLSDWEKNDIGVPQGTRLGPILFLIFINDCPIDLNLQNAPVTDDEGCVFVDDISLWSDGNPREQKLDLERRLQDILSWSDDWGLTFP